MIYYLYHSNYGKLSGFYPNEIQGVFSFRKDDYYSYSSEKEAFKHLKYIKKAVNNKDDQKRWGDKYTKLHLSKAKKLRVINN